MPVCNAAALRLPVCRGKPVSRGQAGQSDTPNSASRRCRRAMSSAVSPPSMPSLQGGTPPLGPTPLPTTCTPDCAPLLPPLPLARTQAGPSLGSRVCFAGDDGTDVARAGSAAGCQTPGLLVPTTRLSNADGSTSPAADPCCCCCWTLCCASCSAAAIAASGPDVGSCHRMWRRQIWAKW